jgi:hypothetical protein
MTRFIAIALQHCPQLLHVRKEGAEAVADLLGGLLRFLEALLQLRTVLRGELTDLLIVHAG